MEPFFKYFVITVISICLFTSCEDEEDVCDDCQSAINHMYEKIADNSCNPDYMGNAMDRLVSDCGQISAQNYAGFMAHSCANESSLRKPECVAVDDEIVKSFLAINNVQVDLRLMSTQNIGDTLIVEIALVDGAANNGSFEMIAGGSADYFLNGLNDGETVDVIVSNPVTDEVIIQESVNNKFWRTGYWSQIRSAEVHYLPLVEEYDVVFNYW